MNRKVKVILIIGFSIISQLSSSQTILQEFGNDNRIKKDKEMIMEISELFQKVSDSLNIIFNQSDTLFIIRGLDIQSRTGYGYVWNNYLKISYSDNKTYKNHKLIKANPKIEIKTNKVTWYEFDNLIPIIEKWDTTGIKNYVDNCGEVLSGILEWNIIRLVKLGPKYNLDLISVRDFGLCRKNENDYGASR